MEKIITLTKIEQLILLEILKKRRLSFNTQDILKTKKFYDNISRLNKYGLINIIRRNSNNEYSLTDNGFLIANSLACCQNKRSEYYKIAEIIEYLRFRNI